MWIRNVIEILTLTQTAFKPAKFRVRVIRRTQRPQDEASEASGETDDRNCNLSVDAFRRFRATHGGLKQEHFVETVSLRLGLHQHASCSPTHR